MTWKFDFWTPVTLLAVLLAIEIATQGFSFRLALIAGFAGLSFSAGQAWARRTHQQRTQPNNDWDDPNWRKGRTDSGSEI